jgi:hypothetical protein
MSGNIWQYLETVAPHAERWNAVGMPETCTAIAALGKLECLENIICSRVRDENLENDLSTALNEVRRSIEQFACGDGLFEERLPKYVAANPDQFCRQDSNGSFI